MIWLVDYNHYRVQMDQHLALLRHDYFKIKKYVRYKKIGQTAPVKTRTFSNGLLRLATLLSYNNVHVRYLHYYMLEKLIETEPIPEIVAFSSVCPTVPLCEKLAIRIKQISPNTKVILGGAQVNNAFEQTKLKFPSFDDFCVGYELNAARYLAKTDLKDIQNPYVDYSLLPFPLSEYSINTFTSVGCPFKCQYCADGRAPFFRTMKDGQLGIMKNLLPERTVIHFFDSILGYNRQGAFEVCQTLNKLDHNFVLSCDMRADILTPQLVRQLEEAGFVEVRMGLDTASSDILKKNGRTIMPDVFIDKLKMIRSYSNLYISLYSITGLPGTTIQRHNETLSCIEYLHEQNLADEIKNAIYVPYPMDGVNYSKRGVHIIDNDWSKYDRASYPVFYLDTMDREEIWKLFIKTAEWMNKCWLKSCGLNNIKQIPIIENEFSEYYEANYN